MYFNCFDESSAVNLHAYGGCLLSAMVIKFDVSVF